MSLLSSQIRNIVDKKLPLVSNLSNVSAILFSMGNVNWAGFYLVINDKLYLGPFQGEVACTIIEKGKGVCGTSFMNKKSIIVPDVHQFKGHIACSTLSNSEIVVPIIKDGNVVALIDIDSPIFNRFNESDKADLEEIASFLADLF